MDVAQETQKQEAFRQAVVNEQRLFYIPSFKLYRGVAGLYDYGPHGCAIKANVLAFWRQAILRQLRQLGHGGPMIDEGNIEFHQQLQNLYKSRRAAKALPAPPPGQMAIRSKEKRAEGC